MNLLSRPSEKSAISGDSAVHGYSVKSLTVSEGGYPYSVIVDVTCRTSRVANRGSSSVSPAFLIFATLFDIVMMIPLLAS